MFEQTIAVSQQLIKEAFGGGNLDLIDELCTDGYVYHDPLTGEQDREASKQQVAAYRAAFPDLEFTIEDSFAAGDRVVTRWIAQGTFENEMMGLQPTGKRGQGIEGITIDRFEDGLVAESWTQWDTLQFMRDLGAIPEGATTA